MVLQIEFYAKKTEEYARQRTLRELQEKKMFDMESQCDELRAENNVHVHVQCTCTCTFIYLHVHVYCTCTCTCTCLSTRMYKYVHDCTIVLPSMNF